MTFLCLYISRWWRQTWDTAPYFTVVNQSEARISTEHGINVYPAELLMNQNQQESALSMGWYCNIDPGVVELTLKLHDGYMHHGVQSGPMKNSSQESPRSTLQWNWFQIKTFRPSKVHFKLSFTKFHQFCCGEQCVKSSSWQLTNYILSSTRQSSTEPTLYQTPVNQIPCSIRSYTQIISKITQSATSDNIPCH